MIETLTQIVLENTKEKGVGVIFKLFIFIVKFMVLVSSPVIYCNE